MITYSQLGNNGRLGNQMFQYATLYSVGLTRGYEIGIPANQRITDVFELPNANLVKNFNASYLYKEKDFSFDPNIFLAPDGTDIFGYFQSGRYFDACRDSLLKEFKFLSKHEEKANQILAPLNSKLVCSLHVRRGDYKNLSDYHTNLGIDYYKSAIDIIKNNIKIAPIHFLIFSDDTEWCKSTFTNGNFVFADSNDDAAELCAMSKCKVHIIANSSFSWWGSWLSGSPYTIAPKNWFGPKGPKNWETVYQQGWMTL